MFGDRLGVQVLDSRIIQGKGLPFAVLQYSVSCNGRLHAHHKKSDCQMIQGLIYLEPSYAWTLTRSLSQMGTVRWWSSLHMS